jgi:hypothetical protein
MAGSGPRSVPRTAILFPIRYSRFFARVMPTLNTRSPIGLVRQPHFAL